MLKTRIVTAIVLVSAFLLALFYLPPIGWLAVSTLIAALAAWEWGALIGFGKQARVSFGLAVVVVAVLTAIANPGTVGIAGESDSAAIALGRWFYYPSAAFWILVAPIWMKSRWRIHGSVLGVLVGAVVILPTWLALVQIKLAGELVLLAIMATVWLADIAAYFSGRTFGRHKLAPAISPGKTWEGFAGGVAVAAAVGAVGVHLLLDTPWWVGLILGALCSLGGTVGDLVESLIKRDLGIKDIGTLLPGHGGILDRFDSVMFIAPFVTMVITAVFYY